VDAVYQYRYRDDNIDGYANLDDADDDDNDDDDDDDVKIMVSRPLNIWNI